MEIKCIDYNSVTIDYENTYPWKISIVFNHEECKKVKEVDFKINGEDDYKIKKYIPDVLNFYSAKKWTAGISKSPFDTFSLNVEIKPNNKFIVYEGRIKDEDDLHFRGCCERNLFFDKQVNIEISPRSCQEIVYSKLNNQYEAKRLKEGWEKWTQKGWIKHALAHELAHFMCIPKLKKEWSSLDEILAQIFACHYDVDSQPTIHVPSGRYLKNHWNTYKINPKDFKTCNDMLRNVFTNSEFWLNNFFSLSDTSKYFLIR